MNSSGICWPSELSSTTTPAQFGCAHVQNAPNFAPIYRFSVLMRCLKSGASVAAAPVPEKEKIGRRNGKLGSHVPISKNVSGALAFRPEAERKYSTGAGGTGQVLAYWSWVRTSSEREVAVCSFVIEAPSPSASSSSASTTLFQGPEQVKEYERQFRIVHEAMHVASDRSPQ